MQPFLSLQHTVTITICMSLNVHYCHSYNREIGISESSSPSLVGLLCISTSTCWTLPTPNGISSSMAIGFTAAVTSCCLSDDGRMVLCSADLLMIKTIDGLC